MSARRVSVTVSAALLGGLGLAPPAHASVQPVAAGVLDFGLGRLGATTGGLLGLAGVVVAVLALARPAGPLGTGRWPLGAVAAGLVGMTLGGLVAATADGGLGTGNGLGGAYVALLLGLTATALGGLARTRARRHTG
ncbi:DUF6223 family protein [Streptomyces zaomyceticus]|uniref:DUF6223 family protein n=1 Tax=Streptomyces zaomyceticus TaxID=68286 RepID=A0ABZ1L9G6_9ACTN|nr:DUF6223 family protein [Streptomyces zaomyceticus]